MSADIMSTQAPLTSPRLKRGKSTQTPVASRPQDDPALIVGLALASARQRPGDTRAISSVLLDRLRHLARSGEPTCRLVLDYLNRMAGANHRTAAHQNVPAAIVSAQPALEDR
ncbi:hypothetical protein [Rhizobium lentis]|uniref:Uncharacterized protein n=1 Tax=Rhizobium lentis TaxID=1138194 RepID=A0A7W9CX32_9HYPH|nr:hypothetical protein [Rhizobium lentis]MBB4576028.1 hypothetical protein [Rhizobium lentis]MBB5552337.1 hypothetical protein [Rhizobium lentis]MBB5563054.1 hypothetical protein [Rhizobium lentis]MBB5569154.1 hypothetical protein [Rhizobium lentis]